MEPNKEYIDDVFQDIIDHITEIYDPVIAGTPATGGVLPYSLSGSLKSIARELIARENKKIRNFPLIALVHDIDENKGKSLANQYVISPRILILEESKKDYFPSERITNTFKSVLIPLYNLLLNELADNPNINIGIVDLIAHKKTNRLDWGTQQANDKLNAFLDGIDIQFTDLKIFKEIVETTIFTK